MATNTIIGGKMEGVLLVTMGVKSLFTDAVDIKTLGLLDLLQQRRVELVQVLRDKVGVHLDAREAGRVAGKMNLEIAFGGEPIAADIALAGPLASVGPRRQEESFDEIGPT